MILPDEYIPAIHGKYLVMVKTVDGEYVYGRYDTPAQRDSALSVARGELDDDIAIILAAPDTYTINFSDDVLSFFKRDEAEEEEPVETPTRKRGRPSKTK